MSKYIISLLLINTTCFAASPRALRDGNIVLWRSAIDASYSRSKDEFEARLAFILGHELGHLANDDYWHLELDYKYLDQITNIACLNMEYV